MPVYFNKLPDTLVEKIFDEYKYGLRIRMHCFKLKPVMDEFKHKYLPKRGFKYSWYVCLRPTWLQRRPTPTGLYYTSQYFKDEANRAQAFFSANCRKSFRLDSDYDSDSDSDLDSNPDYDATHQVMNNLFPNGSG
eukprot:4314525-Prymnesium_polylepis.1